MPDSLEIAGVCGGGGISSLPSTLPNALLAAVTRGSTAARQVVAGVDPRTRTPRRTGSGGRIVVQGLNACFSCPFDVPFFRVYLNHQ